MALAPRAITVLHDVYEPAPKAGIKDCVLQLSNGKLLDIGALCYCKYESRQNTGGYLVDAALHDPRREKAVSNLLNYLRRRRDLSDGSKAECFNKIALFFTFVNQNLPDFNPEKESDCRVAYEDYTRNILARIRLKDGNPNKLKNNSASILQKRARSAVSYMTGLSVENIAMWSTPIRWDDSNDTDLLTNDPHSNEDMLQTYALHCEIIYKTHQLFIDNQASDIRITDTEVIFTKADLASDHALNQFWRSFMPIAMLSYIAASGSTLQVAVESVVDSMGYDHEDKSLRYSGTKARAGGKIVHPTIAATYLKFWKMYNDIRAYYLKRMRASSDLVFPYIDIENSPPKTINPNYISTDKPWARIIRNGNRKPFTARSFRKLKTVLLERVTRGDIALIADMQGHTVKTAKRHYTSVTLQDAAKEISGAISKIYESAMERARTNTYIDVRLVEERNIENETPIGDCQSGDDLSPQLKEGFTNSAPQPDCSRPETCIFCEHHAAHADETDLRKLLSLRFLISELGAISNADIWSNNWAPFIERIEEIISEILIVKPSLNERISIIYEEVEIGLLDEYWRDWARYLTDWGVIQS